MLPILLAFLIGVIAGLRAMTAPMAVSWAARLGWLPLGGTPFAFFGYAAAPYIFTFLALLELVNDKMPKTPSRKSPPSFLVRVVLGAVCGAALGAPSHQLIGGIIAGAFGAVAGTLGGYEARVKMAQLFGRDLPVALLEDAIAVGGAFLIVSRLS